MIQHDYMVNRLPRKSIVRVNFLIGECHQQSPLRLAGEFLNNQQHDNRNNDSQRFVKF